MKLNKTFNIVVAKDGTEFNFETYINKKLVDNYCVAKFDLIKKTNNNMFVLFTMLYNRWEDSFSITNNHIKKKLRTKK